MADVFISYCREDRLFASGRGLEWVLREKAPDITFWRDKEIAAGAVWSHEICDQLRNAKCVVVIWSKHSWISPWVRQEAFYAFMNEKLVPLRVDDEVVLEPPFNGLQTYKNNTEGYEKLVAAIRQKVAGP